MVPIRAPCELIAPLMEVVGQNWRTTEEHSNVGTMEGGGGGGGHVEVMPSQPAG